MTCNVCNDTQRIPIFSASGEQIGESRCPTCCDGIRLVSAQEIARPLSEWGEDHGAVLWWTFPIEEPPYVGTPLDLPQKYKFTINDQVMAEYEQGGWPGYHTHWTPLPDVPVAPVEAMPA